MSCAYCEPKSRTTTESTDASNPTGPAVSALDFFSRAPDSAAVEVCSVCNGAPLRWLLGVPVLTPLFYPEPAESRCVIHRGCIMRCGGDGAWRRDESKAEIRTGDRESSCSSRARVARWRIC